MNEEPAEYDTGLPDPDPELASIKTQIRPVVDDIIAALYDRGQQISLLDRRRTAAVIVSVLAQSIKDEKLKLR